MLSSNQNDTKTSQMLLAADQQDQQCISAVSASDGGLNLGYT